MATNTKIEWADHTFNPWRGCQKVAAGCEHCYADAQAKRNPNTLGIWGPNGTRVVASEAMWREPLKWNEQAACIKSFDCNAGDHADCCPQKDRPRVFCASMADVFEDWDGNCNDSRGRALFTGSNRIDDWWSHLEDDVPTVDLDYVRERLFALIDLTPNLDWLLLTKRPENIAEMWPQVEYQTPDGPMLAENNLGSEDFHRQNVWLGTSIATQADADRNIPELLKCRDLAAKLFVSAEPLLGPIDLLVPHLITRDGYTTLSGNKIPTRSGLDWLIVGGESGHHARPMHPAWARSLRDQCQAAAVPFFFKQWGEWLPIDQMKSCDHLYRSNRIAGPHQDQFAIDEDYGRTCIVPQLILRTDGQHKTLLDPLAFRSDLPGWPAMTAFKVGKKHAGRQLDGIEHNEVPA